MTTALPGLMIPAFSRAMSAVVGPANSLWSIPMLVTTATCGVAHVGGVPPPEQADLDDGDVDGDIGEPAERRRRHRLEVRRAHRDEPLEVGDRGDLLGEVVVADRLAVAADPLVEPLEVRAGVRPDRQAMGHQQPGDHLRRRALAVGARDVDDRVGQLRVAHRRDDGLHALRRSATRSARCCRSWRARRGRRAPRRRSTAAPTRSARLAAGRLATGSRGTSVGLAFVCHRVGVDQDPADVGAPGQLVHRVEQHLFEDRPQPTSAGAPQQRQVGDGLQRVAG